MSSSAYHGKPRLVVSASKELADPWLDDKTTTPYRRGTVRSSKPRRLQPLAATTVQPTAATLPKAPQPLASVSMVRQVTKRRRHATTMKIERTSLPAPDMLEPFVRGQRKPMRTRSTKRLWLGAVVIASLIGALALRLTGWFQPPQVNLADLFTQSRTRGSTPAPVQSNVMVTAAVPGALTQPATLRIDSQPWARVFVDDVLIGNTPQLGIQVQPGAHNVRLHNPERSLQKNITLDAHPGETIERLEQLEP